MLSPKTKYRMAIIATAPRKSSIALMATRYVVCQTYRIATTSCETA
jgi:hypothetical protein